MAFFSIEISQCTTRSSISAPGLCWLEKFEGSRVSVCPIYCHVAWLPNRLPYTLPAQPSWEPVENIIIVEDPGDLYNSYRGHMASIERRPGAKIEGVLNLPGVKEKIGQKVEKNDSNQFVVDLNKQSTTFQREEFGKIL